MGDMKKDRRLGIGTIKMMLLLLALCGESAALTLPASASTGIQSVRIWIVVEGYDEMQEPMIDAEAKGSGYEVESIMLVGGMPARGPAADHGEEKKSTKTEILEAGISSGSQEALKEMTPPEDYVCEIELLADDGRHFATMEQRDIKLSGVKSECTKAVRRNGGSSLVLSVRLTGLKEVLGEIDRAELSADGRAVWSKSVHAASYLVQLYREGERTGLSHRTESAKFDFSPLMTEAGAYHYRVTPLSEKGKKGVSMESMPIRLADRQVEDNRTRWPVNGHGWQQGGTVSYRYSDGLYPQATWLELDGIQYYFNQDGMAAVGRADWN